jgi:hypothetical protein
VHGQPVGLRLGDQRGDGLLVFDQMDSEQAAAFGQVFEAILAGLEDPGPR